MKHSLSVAGTILHRDFLVLWPLALLVATLLALNPFFGDIEAPLIAALFPPLAALSCALLAIGLVQQDAAASLRHDWLTRPITRGQLVLAKAAFLLVAILAPMVAGELIHGLLLDGYTWGEALSRAFSIDLIVVVIVLLSCIVGAITSTFLEAAGAGVAVAVMMVLLFSGILLLTGEGGFFSGSSWILSTLLFGAVSGGAVLVLWLQYARRSTNGARLALAAVAAGTTLFAVAIPWPMVFAIQKAVAREVERAQSLVLRLADDCFRVANIEFGDGPGAQYTDPNYTAATALTAWDSDARRAAGAHAVSFLTSVRVEGVPDGWRALIAHVDATYRTGDGRALADLTPGRHTAVWDNASDGTPIAQHAFLMPRAQHDQLAAQNAGARLEYGLSLLRPVLSVEVPTDGERRFFDGLGYCSAAPDERIRRTILSCWVNRMQPALLVAYTEGAPALGVNVGTPDYRPAALGFLADSEHTTTLPMGGATVRVTAFRAAAHVNRTVEAPAVLGQPSCRPPAYEN